VPTLDESGVPGYEASTFTGIFAPAGIPGPVATSSPVPCAARSRRDVRKHYLSMGVEIMT